MDSGQKTQVKELESLSLYEAVGVLREINLRTHGFGERYSAINEALSIVAELSKEYPMYGYVAEKIGHVKSFFKAPMEDRY